MMEKKVCLITGATSGIGKATALQLAKLDFKLVITARDEHKGQSVLEELKARSGNADIHLLMLDLSEQESVRRAVNQFNQRFDRLDVLINNAGVNLFSRQTTTQGYEKTFATNYLGPFLLTQLLLGKLKQSAPSRIVIVSSSAQFKPDMNDLMSEKKYNAIKVYGQSKTALIYFTYELARKLKGTGVTVNCLHPGVVRTDLARDATGFFKILFKIALKFFITPDEGAKTSVYLATSNDVTEISGKYFVKKKPAQSAEYTYDGNISKQLWGISTQLTHLYPDTLN